MHCILRLLFIVLVVFFSSPLTGQDHATSEKEALPKVFLIGEHEDRYGDLYEDYNDILLSVCNDDMSIAFDRWMNMLTEMEAYAEGIAFDLNGVKVWLKLFWDSTGKIDHLSYFLKPDSRNIDTDELAAFFSSFMNHYTLPITSAVNFTHNGSAKFPLGVMPPTTKR